MQAIQAHRSFQSEANAVIERFNFLQDSQKQDTKRTTKARRQEKENLRFVFLRVFESSWLLRISTAYLVTSNTRFFGDGPNDAQGTTVV